MYFHQVFIENPYSGGWLIILWVNNYVNLGFKKITFDGQKAIKLIISKCELTTKISSLRLNH